MRLRNKVFELELKLMKLEAQVNDLDSYLIEAIENLLDIAERLNEGKKNKARKR